MYVQYFNRATEKVHLFDKLYLKSGSYLVDVAKLFLLGSDAVMLRSQDHNSLFFDVATLVGMDLDCETGL